jgi:hypothetical protein
MRHLKILISGASGFIGTYLASFLGARGYQVFRLVRRVPRHEKEILWNQSAVPQITGYDAVIHLAGETIMGRWTAEKKARILDSRTTGTQNLAMALAKAPVRPQVLLSASAVGYYGAHGAELLTEDSAPGHDFLAQVAQQWEAATQPARDAGIRTVNLRIGMVLSADGGALRRMVTPFRLGLGGRIGPGSQWMSWITLTDLVAAMEFALENSSLAGPVNFVAPHPVRSAEFARTLGRVLRRPAVFPVPAAIVKLIFGEMGESLLLSGQRVVPEKLQAAGFEFQHAELESALRAMLGR